LRVSMSAIRNPMECTANDLDALKIIIVHAASTQILLSKQPKHQFFISSCVSNKRKA
jgi:hypothetical protein